MDTILLDTDVFSFLFKNDSRAKDYEAHLSGKRLAICFVTVAELYRWAIHRKWGAQKMAALRTRLQQFLIIPYDDAMAWEWAKISSIKGHPIAVSDAWIAAAALRHGIPLATHNHRHFQHLPELKIISES
jgi:tRNA(fMet)-specific endonuclease VapC